MRIIHTMVVHENDEDAIYGLSDTGALFQWCAGYSPRADVYNDASYARRWDSASAEEAAAAKAAGKSVRFQPGRTAGWIYVGGSNISQKTVDPMWPLDEIAAHQSRNGGEL